MADVINDPSRSNPHFPALWQKGVPEKAKRGHWKTRAAVGVALAGTKPRPPSPRSRKPITARTTEGNYIVKLRVYLVTGLIGALFLSGCAGREAHPVSVTQVGDDSLSCPAIAAQVSANEEQVRNLDGQRESHNTTNAVVGVVGAVLFWPALFALDTTDYERQEMTALHERDTYLQQVAASHGCNGPTTTSAPMGPVTSVPTIPAPATPASATTSALPVCNAFTSTNCQPKPSQMPANSAD
jgi:hypothetical protein